MAEIDIPHMEEAERLAQEIEANLVEINSNLKRLNNLGWVNARLIWSDATRAVTFAASQTKEIKLR